MRLVAPETITFTQSGFCPGCGHGLAVRLIAEVMEEMELSEKLLAVVDVACGSLNIDSWRFDTIMAAHGRPIATAVGVKKIRKKKSGNGLYRRWGCLLHWYGGDYAHRYKE